MEYLSRELPTHLHTTRHSSSQQQENLPREPPTHLHTTRHSSSPQQENLPRESTTLARRRRFWRTRFLATVCAVLDRHRRRARRRPWLLSSAKPPLWRTLAVPETHRRSRGASRAPEAWLWRELALLSLSRFCGTFCQPIHHVRRRSSSAGVRDSSCPSVRSSTAAGAGLTAALGAGSGLNTSGAMSSMFGTSGSGPSGGAISTASWKSAGNTCCCAQS